jgi:hypothetical protein
MLMRRLRLRRTKDFDIASTNIERHKRGLQKYGRKVGYILCTRFRLLAPVHFSSAGEPRQNEIE